MVCVSGFSSRFSSEYADPGWVIFVIPYYEAATSGRRPLSRSLFAAKRDHAQRDGNQQDRRATMRAKITINTTMTTSTKWC
jgi:hypothetical protein